MRYSFDITISPATSQAVPQETMIKLTTGTITKFLVRFLAGCHYGVHLIISDGLQQLAPATQGADLVGDNVTLDIPMDFIMLYKPYELKVTAWAPDTEFEHLVTIWVDLDETKEQRQLSFLEQLAMITEGL